MIFNCTKCKRNFKDNDALETKQLAFSLSINNGVEKKTINKLCAECCAEITAEYCANIVDGNFKV